MHSTAYLFILTVTVATVTPGPSMLLALNHGIRYGSRRALSTALGNAVATALQCAVSLAGLGLILAQTAWIFTLLRTAGAAYLIYFGLSLILTRGRDSQTEAAPVSKHRNLFIEAFWVTLSNPKAILFFSALFPQFIDGNLGVVKAGGMLAFTVCITFVSMMAYAILGQRIQALLSRSGVRRLFDRLLGATMMGLGLGLAIERD